MDIDERFKNLLKHYKLDTCKCGRQIDRGDAAWNCGSTEYGTPYSVLEIICQACDNEIFYGSSWYPEIDDFEKFVDELEECLED